MDTTTTLLYNALKELRQFVVDNMDALPNSEAVRFNALKALNEFDVAENDSKKPASKPVEIRTIVMRNTKRDIVMELDAIIDHSQRTEKTAGDKKESQFHMEALANIHTMLCKKIMKMGEQMQFIHDK